MFPNTTWHICLKTIRLSEVKTCRPMYLCICVHVFVYTHEYEIWCIVRILYSIHRVWLNIRCSSFVFWLSPATCFQRGPHLAIRNFSDPRDLLIWVEYMLISSNREDGWESSSTIRMEMHPVLMRLSEGPQLYLQTPPFIFNITSVIMGY